MRKAVKVILLVITVSLVIWVANRNLIDLKAELSYAFSFEEIETGLPGVGILGDSNSDEYRADDNRGGIRRYRINTLNWAEHLAQSRGLYFGKWSQITRGEPRRKGFEFNWARSAAVSNDLLGQGQLSGIVSQINEGKVKLVVIHIGANDYAPYNPNGYRAIYEGIIKGEELDSKVDGIVNDIEVAIEGVLGKGDGDVGIIVTNIFDWNLHPAIWENYPDESKRKLVTDAINKTNNEMKQLTSKYNIAYNDLNQMAHDIFINLDENGNMMFGGEEINVLSIGDEPHNGFLGDGTHAGTVLEGIFANQYISVFNSFYGEVGFGQIESLSETEILQNAGIKRQTDRCLRLTSYPGRLRCLKIRN